MSRSNSALDHLIRLGAGAAICGGGLRVVAVFVPFVPGSSRLELLYGAIDIGLMFGLIAIYLHVAAAAGTIGLAGFCVALVGIASIVGPDAPAFGIDIYLLGSALFLLGLSPLAWQMLRLRLLPAAGAAWLLATALGIAASISGNALALAATGLALGVGFVLGGAQVLQRSS